MSELISCNFLIAHEQKQVPLKVYVWKITRQKTSRFLCQHMLDIVINMPCHYIVDYIYLVSLSPFFSSVVWYCWFGSRNSIRAVKNEHRYAGSGALTGARCR